MSEPGRAAVPRAITSHARTLRWSVAIGSVVMVLIGLGLMLLLTQATNNRALYERNYERLFVVNVVVATLLLAVIAWIGVRLLVRLRQGRFGSRLLVKLAAIFALVGIAPGLLIYVVSYQFVSRSIESWFDVKVEGALDAGLSLGRVTLDTLANDLGNKTRLAAEQIADSGDTASGLALERIRTQLSANDVILWNSSSQMLSSAGQSRFQLNPERPTAQQLRSLKNQRVVTVFEGLDEGSDSTIDSSKARVKALALVPSTGFGLLAEPRVLQVSQSLPPTLISNALAVEHAYREYQERALARTGLQRMYIGTLTLSLFLAVFGAVLLAVLLGNQLARPLLVLAEGVKQVAAGDLTPKAALQGKDELGGLTRSFAEMTQQLSDARQAVDQSMQEVNAARANLQTILDNLTAGVIVLDPQGRIRSSNPGAARILRVPLDEAQGMVLADIEGLQQFAQGVEAQFEAFLGERGPQSVEHWQQSFELHDVHVGPQANAVSIVARGAELPGSLRLLVFDDISEIVSAQRAQAWGEVARRLAHEIKNPLTPIQLSAERLAMKLEGKLQATEQALLDKSVKTIVDQVDAMKRLVNEFRDYARLPAAQLTAVDLNSLIVDVMHLYQEVGGESHAKVQLDLDAACPAVLGDAQQLRQVIHNLLQNAMDATESQVETDDEYPVVLKTRWIEASRRVRLLVQDSGPGFAENILKRAFEPYVTTKAKGTGLGLAVVKKIADEHGARVTLSNRVVEGEIQGAQVSLSFATADHVAN